MDTKDKILSAALTLFADEGFEAVTVARIAQAVGIKPPSLYKHFESKQAIFKAILERLNSRYLAQASALSLDGSSPQADSLLYPNMGEETLLKTVTGLFSFFLHDEDMSRFRRLLTVEQFRDPRLRALYGQLYEEGPLSYQAALFKKLMDAGFLISAEPRQLALEFYSPIFFLLQLCDREPQREPEALQVLAAHVRQFARHYQKEAPSK